jgi:NAD(P)H-dependent flavin oxidoreductase YrpB (nitropropane dioxygenase family)
MKTQLFESKHPIVSVAMNQVSDLNLAVAVKKAEAVPSISFFNYYKYDDKKQRVEHLVSDLRLFEERTGSKEIIISLSEYDFINDHTMNTLLEWGAKFVELTTDRNLLESTGWGVVLKKATSFHSQGLGIFLKTMGRAVISSSYTIDWGSIDGVIIKGSEGAGRCDIIKTPLEDIVREVKSLYPDLHVIPSGGVSNSQDVNKMIAAGATAVGIGTLFAASEESRISTETKLKMIEASEPELIPRSENQRGLYFGAVGKQFDTNQTRSLIIGITNPEAGLVFAGKAISEIKEILPVKTIVERLVG